MNSDSSPKNLGFTPWTVVAVIAAFVLGKVPPPTLVDVEQRSERATMAREDRMRFIRDLLWILIPLAATYLMLTAFRDYRDNFQAELFGEVGIDIADQ